MFDPSTHMTARHQHNTMKNSVAPVYDHTFQANQPRRMNRLFELLRAIIQRVRRWMAQRPVEHGAPETAPEPNLSQCPDVL